MKTYTITEHDLEVIDRAFNALLNEDKIPSAAYKITQLRDTFRKAKKGSLELKEEE